MCPILDTARVILSRSLTRSHTATRKNVRFSDICAHVIGRARQMLNTMLTVFFAKGKPVVRRGRKATGQGTLPDSRAAGEEAARAQSGFAPPSSGFRCRTRDLLPDRDTDHGRRPQCVVDDAHDERRRQRADRFGLVQGLLRDEQCSMPGRELRFCHGADERAWTESDRDHNADRPHHRRDVLRRRHGGGLEWCGKRLLAGWQRCRAK